MSKFLLAFGLIVLTSTAQADIICTLTGCWETGKKIIQHGGVYRGLEYKKPDKNGVWRRVNIPEASDAYAPRAQGR